METIEDKIRDLVWKSFCVSIRNSPKNFVKNLFERSEYNLIKPSVWNLVDNSVKNVVSNSIDVSIWRSVCNLVYKSVNLKLSEIEMIYDGLGD
jgi:hypothetical protein